MNTWRICRSILLVVGVLSLCNFPTAVVTPAPLPIESPALSTTTAMQPVALETLPVETPLIQPATPEPGEPAVPAATRPAPAADNPEAPTETVRLIFIHHSTGENWLADENGRLGLALGDNNYFVSDTNYGWGPDVIGDTTDIGHWWTWFRSERSVVYWQALMGESEQHAAYTRLDAPDPTHPNQVILFKSCFPNSQLGGSPSDPPASGDNPLIGQEAYSEYHTVANAKGIYAALLEVFAAHPETLFVAITAPPLQDADTDSEQAANARAFNNWLVNDWLADYPYANVAVFDFYNVLTSNAGSPNANDLDAETGNHHRWWQGSVQHVQGVENNFLSYPSEDSHPSEAGNLKATAEFVPLLNVFYHRWQVQLP